MHFSHSNLLDTCVADDSWFEARYRPFGSAPLHNLTSAHGVYWNTEGRPSSRSYVVHSQQSRYGYVIGTRGAVTSVKIDGSSTAKTNPVDHLEGAGQGGTLTPFSLFREQRRRRLGLPAIDMIPGQSLLFPQNTTSILPVVRFGDSTVPPSDAEYLWEQSAGAGPVDLADDGGAVGVNAAFVMPGTHTLTLTVSRHGSLEDDWAVAAPVEVKVLPPGWLRGDLPPVADAFVQLGQPDANVNTNPGTLWMKTAGTGSSVNREIFMRFDLSGLAGRVVREAILEMHATDPDTGATAQTHWVADDSSVETALTWNNRPSATLLLQTWPLAKDFMQRLELTERVFEEASGDGAMSLRHSIVAQSNSATVFKYASREAADPALRPRLSVLHSEDWPDYGEWIASFPQVSTNQRGTSTDADGDGRTNLEEYALRSLPHVSESQPANLRLVRGAVGYWHLVYPGGANPPPGVYPQLEHRASLSGSGWQVIPRVTMMTVGDDLVFTPGDLPAGAPTGFFRLRLVTVAPE